MTLAQARAVALDWAQASSRDFGIETSQSLTEDTKQVFHFKRSGLHGSLRVTEEQFVLEVSLGFLLGTFKERIETELLRNLEIRLMDVPISAEGDKQTVANTPRR